MRRPPALPAVLAASLRVADRGGTAVAPWADAMGRSADGFRASPDAPAHRLAACERVETAAAAVLRACSASSDAAAADMRGAAHPASPGAAPASLRAHRLAAASASRAVLPRADAPSSPGRRQDVSRASAAALAASACPVPRCATGSSAVRRAVARAVVQGRRVLLPLVLLRLVALRRLAVLQPLEVPRRAEARAAAALRPEPRAAALPQLLAAEAVRRPEQRVPLPAARALPSSPDAVVRARARSASVAPPSSAPWPSWRRPSAAPAFPRTCRRLAARCRAAVRCARQTSVRPLLQSCSTRSSARCRDRASTARALPGWWSRAARRPCRSGLLPIVSLN